MEISPAVWIVIQRNVEGEALCQRGAGQRAEPVSYTHLDVYKRQALMLLGVLLVVIFGVWGTNYDAQAFIYFQF